MNLKRILFGLFLFLIVGNITVYAEDAVTITGESEDGARISTNYTYAGEGIKINCNVNASFKLEYSIGNGEYKTFTRNTEYPNGVFRCSAGQEISLNEIEIEKNEINNSENTYNLKLTIDGNESIDPIYFTQKLYLLKDSYIEYTYNGETLLTSADIYLPFNAVASIEKVEDPNILNSLKSYDVYRLSIEADGKRLGYYADNFYKKYNNTLEAYNSIYRFPSNINDEQYNIYMYSKDLEYLKLRDELGYTPSSHREGDTYFRLENPADYFKLYDNGYIVYKSEESERNFVPITTRTNEVIEVPNTSAKIKLIVILSGVILSLIGVFILNKNLVKQINE